jgi:hypothetical protein
VETDKGPGKPPDILMIDLLFMSGGVVLHARLSDTARRRRPFAGPVDDIRSAVGDTALEPASSRPQ